LYEDSVWKIVPAVDLMSGWMNTASPMIAIGIHARRTARRPRPINPIAINTSDSSTNVLRVPMAGIKTNTGRNVPKKLPTVEMA